jgi:hypothetical protein
MVESVTRANRITLYFPPDEGRWLWYGGEDLRRREGGVGECSKEGGLLKRTNSWRRARNAQRNQQQQSLRSRVLYTRTLGEMHPRVCVRMCVCVCVCVWGVSFWIPILRLFIMSSSFSPYSFVLCVCVFFFFVFAKDWRPVHWVHYAPADIDNPFTHTHTHSASRRFRIYRLISSDQLANGISP